jgi:hypothetical protein
MKIAFITLIAVFITTISFAQDTDNCGGSSNTTKINPEKIGIVISSNDAETVWNAFRLANYSQNHGDTIMVFLLGKGVEAEKISSKDFDIKGQMEDFDAAGLTDTKRLRRCRSHGLFNG